MAREKVTAYMTPDLAEALRRVARLQDQSVSDIVQGAIATLLKGGSTDVERATVLIRLDQISRRLAILQSSQATLLELIARLSPNRPKPAGVNPPEEAPPE